MKWFSDNQDRLAKNAGPGHWNDPDMVSTVLRTSTFLNVMISSYW